MKRLFSKAQKQAPTLSHSLLNDINQGRGSILTLALLNKVLNDGQLAFITDIDQINAKLKNIMNQSGETVDTKLQVLIALIEE